MPEYHFLGQQRGLYDAQSRHVEAWQAAHVEAMQCREIEDSIHLGLMVLARFDPGISNPARPRVGQRKMSVLNGSDG
jgi:hypothetical protein